MVGRAGCVFILRQQCLNVGAQILLHPTERGVAANDRGDVLVDGARRAEALHQTLDVAHVPFASGPRFCRRTNLEG